MDLAQISAQPQDYNAVVAGLAQNLAMEQLKVVVLCRMLAEQEAEHHKVIGELTLKLQERRNGVENVERPAQPSAAAGDSRFVDSQRADSYPR